jgi:uncharacterized protein YjiS (DUF1127 family)
LPIETRDTALLREKKPKDHGDMIMDRLTRSQIDELAVPALPRSGAEIAALARREQSRAIAKSLTFLLRVLGYVTGVTAFVNFAKRISWRRRTASELRSLGWRVLEDIGLQPDQVGVAAARSAYEEFPPVPSLIGQLVHWAKAEYDRVTTARTLRAMDLRLLADIGVEPSQIDDVAGGLAHPLRALAAAAEAVSEPVIEMAERTFAPVRVGTLNWRPATPANSEEALPRAA